MKLLLQLKASNHLRKGINNLTFEEQLKRLSDIVDILEKGEEDLDSSMALYKEGLDLSLKCKKQIDSAQLKITKYEENIK